MKRRRGGRGGCGRVGKDKKDGWEMWRGLEEVGAVFVDKNAPYFIPL